MSNDKDRVYVYKSQAIRDYGLTERQISVGRNLGMLHTKIVENPADKNRTSLLIDLDSLLTYLSKIQDHEIKKAQNKVAVIDSRKCIVCGASIEARRTPIGHLSEYCDEHDPDKTQSEW